MLFYLVSFLVKKQKLPCLNRVPECSHDEKKENKMLTKLDTFETLTMFLAAPEYLE